MTTDNTNEQAIITSAADLLAAYAHGERDFAHRVRLPYGAGLRGAGLRGANLRYADLRGADLRYANLRGADLRGADLRYADLTGADLRYANLRYANLRCADLRYADLRYANLHDVRNIPVASHDLLAELLRQAAGGDVQRRAFAGLLLVSRDWCWKDYQRLREAGTWPQEIIAWVGETLGVYASLVPFLRRTGWLPRANTDGESVTREREERATC